MSAGAAGDGSSGASMERTGGSSAGNDLPGNGSGAIEMTGRKHSHSHTKDVEEMNGGDAIESNGGGLSRALRAKVAPMLRSLRHLNCAWPFLDPVPVDQVRPLLQIMLQMAVCCRTND